MELYRYVDSSRLGCKTTPKKFYGYESREITANEAAEIVFLTLRLTGRRTAGAAATRTSSSNLPEISK